MSDALDFAGSTDISPAWSTTRSPRQALVDSLFRRLRTPRGRLALIGGDPTYGYDLSLLIGAAVRISEVEQKVSEQIFADERVEDARVSATYVQATSTLTITIGVTDAQGPFEFIVSVNELSVELYFQEAT